MRCVMIVEKEELVESILISEWFQRERERVWEERENVFLFFFGERDRFDDIQTARFIQPTNQPDKQNEFENELTNKR